jgi:uncharacterized protein (TIGR03435 family)
MKRRVLAAVGGLVGIAAAALSAQAPERPAFAAASIKPSPAGRRDPVNKFLPGGRYSVVNTSLRRIITFAHLPLLGIQITGGPSWLGSELFDIDAKADGNPSAGELRVMLQTLLADRFKLRTHTERRDAPVWALTKARSDGRLGPALLPSTAECPSEPGTAPQQFPVDPATGKPWDCGFVLKTRSTQIQKDEASAVSFQFGLGGKSVTMAQLAVQLSGYVPLGRVVLDRSALAGNFDFEMWFANENGSVSSEAPSIYTAIQEQLGLKLESTTAPVDFLVIDSVEHPMPD